jgi:hypothetical protein
MDGSWTDILSIARFGLRPSTEGAVIRIEVIPLLRVARGRSAPKALAELVSKRDSLHTIQIGSPAFASAVRSKLRTLEEARLGLCIAADGVETTYPVAVVFGPDEVTLNVG